MRNRLAVVRTEIAAAQLAAVRIARERVGRGRGVLRPLRVEREAAVVRPLARRVPVGTGHVLAVGAVNLGPAGSCREPPVERVAVLRRSPDRAVGRSPVGDGHAVGTRRAVVRTEITTVQLTTVRIERERVGRWRGVLRPLRIHREVPGIGPLARRVPVGAGHVLAVGAVNLGPAGSGSEPPVERVAVLRRGPDRAVGRSPVGDGHAVGARRAVVRAEIATVQLAAVRVERERVGGRRSKLQIVPPSVAGQAASIADVISVGSTRTEVGNADGLRRRRIAP